MIIECVSYYSVLNHTNLVNILPAKGPKRKPHIQPGDRFCKQFVPLYLSYVVFRLVFHVKYWYHLQSSDTTLLQEAPSLSTALQHGGVFSWVSFFQKRL